MKIKTEKNKTKNNTKQPYVVFSSGVNVSEYRVTPKRCRFQILNFKLEFIIDLLLKSIEQFRKIKKKKN